MPTGKVKWFDPKKGYGFIVGDEGQDVFVHYTSISCDGFKALKEGMKDKEGKVLMKPTEGMSDDELKALVKHVRSFKK